MAIPPQRAQMNRLIIESTNGEKKKLSIEKMRTDWNVKEVHSIISSRWSYLII